MAEFQFLQNIYFPNQSKLTEKTLSSRITSEEDIYSLTYKMEETADSSTVYYMIFDLNKQPSISYNISVVLRRTDTENGLTFFQTIDEFNLPTGQGEFRYQKIFKSGLDDFKWNEIVFILTKNIKITKNTWKELIKADSDCLLYEAKTINFINSGNSEESEEIKTVDQIGVQGEPGQLIAIDGEQIMLGKNGIYELNNGITINSFSYVPNNSESNFPLLVDYRIASQSTSEYLASLDLGEIENGI